MLPKLSLPNRSELVHTGITLLLAAFGGAVFFELHLPAAWLSGAMIGATCGMIFGVKLHVPDVLREITMLVLGISMGVGVTPATLQAIGRWPASLAILGCAVIAIILVAIMVSRAFGWDRNTAMYASAPGALSTVLILAEASGADMRRVVIAQSLRLFLLVAVLPFALSFFDPHAGVSSRLAPLGASHSLVDYGLLALLGVLGAGLARLLNVPAPLLIGAALASSIGHGTGFLKAAVPMDVQIPAFIILGAYIGLRFRGTTLAILRAELGASLLIFVSSGAVAFLGALLVHFALGIPVADSMVAFAPGGIEAMTIIAFSLSLDVAYVGTHHLARFLAIAMFMPIISRYLGAPSGR